MLFAAFEFSPLYFLVGLVVVLAVVAGIGLGHAAAGAKRENIRKKEVDGRLSVYFEKSRLPHIARYFRCLEHGDEIGAMHEKKRIAEIAMNDKEIERIFDHASESWLENRIGDPDARAKIVRDIEFMEKRHHGTELGAIDAAVLKIVKGVKETATVPTGDGGTVTVPVREVHHHYHGEPKPSPAAPKPATEHAGPVSATGAVAAPTLTHAAG